MGARMPSQTQVVNRYLVPNSGPEQSLVSKSLCAFVREVGARSAAPGGGSVAAASAAMGAALASMAGLMTYGRRQFEHLDATMRRLIPPFHAASAELTALVDADARAFQAYLTSGSQRGWPAPLGDLGPLVGTRAVAVDASGVRHWGRWAACGNDSQKDLLPKEATKLPKDTPEDRDRRAAALQEGLRQAVAVPLALAEKVASLWPALQELAQCGNLACRSDLQVAAKALETGVFGAYFNVLINLKDVTDSAFKEQTRQHISSLLQEAKTQAALVLDRLEARQE
ncbi:formimidoyltransferase-cyclodeaminase isoform X2 [Prionailurus iriomotensis]